MDFGATISRALKISWQHKALWLIALLPVLVGLVIFIPVVVVLIGSVIAGVATGINTDNGRGMAGMFGAGVLAAYCLFFIGYIALIVLALVTQGALIDGVRQAEDEGRVQFGTAMGAGWRSAGKLFVSGLIISLPIFGILCVGFAGAAAVALSASNAGINNRGSEDAFAAIFSGGFCVVLGLYCVILIYALLASGIYVMGQRAIVLHNAGPMEGLRRGWQLFRANLGNIFLLAIVLIGVQVIFSVVLNIGMQFTLLPAMGPLAQLGRGARPEDLQRVFSGLLAASFGLGFIVLFVVSLIWGFLYSIFTSAAWTLAYRQFVSKDMGGTATLPPTSPAIPELR